MIGRWPNLTQERYNVCDKPPLNHCKDLYTSDAKRLSTRKRLQTEQVDNKKSNINHWNVQRIFSCTEHSLTRPSIEENQTLVC